MEQLATNSRCSTKEKLLNSYIQQQIKLNKVPIQAPIFSTEESSIEKVYLLRNNIWKKILMTIINICLIGIPYLIGRWYHKIAARMYFSVCYKIEKATHVLIKCQNNTNEILKIKIENQIFFINENTLEDYSIQIEYKFFRYFYDKHQEKFMPVQFDLSNMTSEEIHQKYGKGLNNQEEIRKLNHLFGKNLIDIQIKSAWQIFIDEIMSPVYIFQSFGIAVWILDQYMQYGIFILLMTIYEIVTTIIKTKMNLKNLKEISYYQSNITVFRGTDSNPLQNKVQISTCDLLPGDIFEVEDNSMIPCDAIILNGECIVNESILTGESIPIAKSSLPYNQFKYNPEEHKSFTLYCGTQCLQTRYYGEYNVLALAIQTGFNTEKGQLIRAILFPKSTSFKFNTDSFKFIGFISIIVFMTFIWSIIYQVQRDLDHYKLVLRALELLTIAIPPSLPLCMQGVLESAITRLKKQNIFCISAQRVNMSGRLQVMCFDKTGTLTEEGLNIYGVKPNLINLKTKTGQFQKIIKDISQQGILTLHKQPIIQNFYQKLIEILASCHSITYVNNNMIGDPLDIQMFQSTDWILEIPSEDNYDDLVKAIVKRPDLTQEIGLLKSFNFSSLLQRMSVIIRNSLTNKFELHVKGAPEKLREICLQETIPENFHEILQKYTKRGYRVLALATKELNLTLRKIHKVKRENVEKELNFMGFLIMINKLKPVSRSVIENLQNSNIECIMITGDNALTAISVARDVSLVDKEEKIYLAELEMQNGKRHIKWQDFECAENKLDPITLEPINELDSEDERQSINQEEDLVGMVQISFENQIPLEKTFKATLRNNSQVISDKESQVSPNEFGVGFQQDMLSEYNPNVDLSVPEFAVSDDPYSLAITGRTFQYILSKVEQEQNPQGKYAKILEKILFKTKIYARMHPEQKATLVNLIKGRGLITGMCGDGANDCAALKAADVGVSLSNTEASIAASFTSKIQDISCIIKIICEGRATLTTSFHVFKFIVFYSVSQGFGVGILYSLGSDLTTNMYTFIDFFLSLYLALTISEAKPLDKITALKPKSSLISFSVLFSMIGQLLISLISIIIMLRVLFTQPFYSSQREDQEADLYSIFGCQENTIVFYILVCQLIAVSFAFSVGKPFRQPFYQNYFYLFSVIVLQAYNFSLVLKPDKFSHDFYELYDFPFSFKIHILIMLIANMIIMIIFDWIIVKKISFWYQLQKKKFKRKISIFNIDHHK